MDLVSVELPKRKETEKKACQSLSEEKWPYGLRLCFEKEQVEQIPSLKNFKVGESVIVTAKAVVTSIRQSENKEDVSYSLEMQIEKINCSPEEKKSLEKMSPKEYREARGK